MAGRILSKENESKLRTAVESIMGILGLLEDDPEPMSEPADTEEPVAEAAFFEVSLTEYAPLTSQE